MVNGETQYLHLLAHVLDNGTLKGDRTGVGTKSIFSSTIRVDLSAEFPLLTTKKMFFTGMVDELLWFLSGSTNVNDLPENVQHWWTPWADERGELGPIYGQQYRSSRWWEAVDGELQTYEKDQLKDLIRGLVENPNSRRHVINLWHSAAMDHARLPCCHGAIIQFYVANGELSCQMYQRSADLFLGVPVNLASYSLLTMMVAKVCGYRPKMFSWVGGDCHLYLNHVEQAKGQLQRYPRQPPKVEIATKSDITHFTRDDFKLSDYESWPAIKAPLAI